MIASGRSVLPIEIKAATHPGYGDVRHLLLFRGEYGRVVTGGLVLHAGTEVYWLAEGILAAPWWRVVYGRTQ